jgi:hypothetical protein
MNGEGQPRLPIIIENFTLPAGFDVTDIQILSNITTQLPGTYNISIGAGPDEDGTIGKSSQLSAAASYPSKLFDYITMEDKDGSTLLYLYFYPFQWDSATGIVTYYSNLTLYIDFEDAMEDSVSLAVVKSIEKESGGVQPTLHISWQVANNGSNPVYNVHIKEVINNKEYFASDISILAKEGINSSQILGIFVQSPFKLFSGWVVTQTLVSYTDAAGTPYTQTFALSYYHETMIGIIFIILGLIMFIAIAVAVIKLRS